MDFHTINKLGTIDHSSTTYPQNSWKSNIFRFSWTTHNDKKFSKREAKNSSKTVIMKFVFLVSIYILCVFEKDPLFPFISFHILQLFTFLRILTLFHWFSHVLIHFYAILHVPIHIFTGFYFCQLSPNSANFCQLLPSYFQSGDKSE